MECSRKVTDVLSELSADPENIMFHAIHRTGNPTKCAEQCVFFSKLSEELKDLVTDADKSIVVGGDFNVILDQDLDGRGRNKKRKDLVQYVEDMIIEHDLVDIWRIRNPTDTRFTWCKNHR